MSLASAAKDGVVELRVDAQASSDERVQEWPHFRDKLLVFRQEQETATANHRQMPRQGHTAGGSFIQNQDGLLKLLGQLVVVRSVRMARRFCTVWRCIQVALATSVDPGLPAPWVITSW
jgi:hypothetical protein